MEAFNTDSQSSGAKVKIQITWEQLREVISRWPKEKKYYGVPRGGQYIAALTGNPVSRPEEADFIVDDIIDSGKTGIAYRERYPSKPFFAAIDKKKLPESAWVVFPWETEGNEADGVENNVLRLLQRFDNPNREGLLETPRRYVKFLREFMSAPDPTFTAFSSEGMDQMIIQSNIPFYSMCEHHLVPFFGVGHIAYIPNENKIVGLSKLARTLEYYASRFQNQERITQQVAERIEKELQPIGVAVSLTARHLCMEMRGAKKHDTFTTTTKLIGVFKESETAKSEFLNRISIRY